MKLPRYISNLGTVNFKGSFTGFANDFVAYGKLNTAIGQVRTDISLKQDDTSAKLAYNGQLQSFGFDVGKFLDEERIGKVTLDAKVTGKGLAKNDINAVLVGNVQSVELVGYDYRNVEVNGEFERSMFTGDVTVQDTNLALVFRGGFDLSQELPQFNFHADVVHANLYEINLLRDREDATVSGVVDVDFSGDDIDNLLGVIEVSNATYQQKDDSLYTVNRFVLNVEEEDEIKSLKLRSDIVDADFHGIFNFRSIPLAVNNLMQKHLPSYAREFKALDVDKSLEFDFSMALNNTAILSYFLAKDLVVSSESNFNGNYSSLKNEVFLSGDLQTVTYKGIQVDQVQIQVENPGKEFQLGFNADRVNITDSIFLSAVEISSFTFNDSLGLVVKWDNKTKIENAALIRGVASFPKNEEVSFHLEPSKITIAGLDWNVESNNLVRIDTSTVEFSNFRFLNELQSIGLNGSIANDPNANLKVNLKDFDLANFNIATKRSGINLEGKVSGNAQVSGIYDELFLTNQLRVDSLILNDVLVGSGELNNTWIPSTKSIQVFGLFKRGDKTSLSVVGEFLPGADRKQNFNLKASVDRIPLSLFDPYVKKVLTEVKGTAKADLTLKGKLKTPKLSGYVVLKEADMMVTYLNTRFKVNDTVQVRPDGFYLENLTTLDEEDNEGKINGWVKHDNFKNFRFDAKLNAQEFLALNTNSAMNTLYYGRAYGSGQVRFYGVPKDMHLDLAMKTERGTRFNIPLFGAKSVNESEFITFVKPKGVDDEPELEDKYQVSFKNLTLDMDIEVTSDAMVQLIFDPAVGDIIKGKGDGDLSLSLDKAGNFRMFGDYYINKGEYLFTL
ncbi:MAG: translocation/assembly module TamB domain-containing protein, partial [Flavobacteriales bacterium]